MCFRMKLVGGPWWARMSGHIVHVRHLKRDLCLLLGLLVGYCSAACLLYPAVEIRLGHDFEIRLHVVMAQAAELRAYNFVLADFRRREMHRYIQAGNKVLLDSSSGTKKECPRSLECIRRWTSLFTGIANSAVTMSSLESGSWPGPNRKNSDCLRQSCRDGWGRTCLGAGIAEIESELAGLRLNGHGVRGPAA